MRQRKFFNKHLGQSITEYAVLLAVVAAALIAMQVYMKRGIQGRMRDLADQISPRESHYERGQTDSNYNITQTGTTVQQYKDGVSRTYQDGTDEKQESRAETITRSGNETVYPDVQE